MPMRPEICPACSAPLRIEPSMERVRCAYCGTPFAWARHDSRDEVKHAPTAPAPITPLPPTFIPPHGRSYWVWLLLNPRGRVGRGGFWLGMLVTGGLMLLVALLNQRELLTPVVPWLYLVGTYIPIVVSIKRARARNRPPVLAALWLLPVFGPLWLAFDLGLMDTPQTSATMGAG